MSVRSTCCYCGTGCGVVIETRDGAITGVVGDERHPSSRGRLCSKGSTLHLTMAADAQVARARSPELRRTRDVERGKASWDEALDFVAQRFAECIAEHGPDSVAFYVSGQLLTEDYYAFNKLAKGLVGTANIDTNSRLCMSSAVAGYAQTLGVDAPPACYEDLEHAGCLFIAGSNTAFAHPVLFRRIEAAREANPDLKVIVVDPRRTQTARFADLHLAILPGTDVALFHGMLHVMLWERLVDEDYIAAHTEGFDAVRTLVREYTSKAVAETCGVRAEDIEAAARIFATSKATLSLYCQGLNQSTSGTAKNATLVGLHLATGQIGRAGAGPFSLTGQPNAMGGREVGGLATTLAAHRDLGNAADREEMAALWGSSRIPSKPGLTAVELFEALRAGRVKMVWIACTNPAQSMPDANAVAEALRAAELVVLQEAYADTETAAFADVLLPATSWGEKDGTVTNSERRVSRVRPAVAKPFEARHDWEIACDFARRLKTRLGHDDPIAFDHATAEAIWNEHRESTRGRDLDITGLSYAMLDAQGPQQWPFPEGATQGAARLYGDGRFATPSGRARFQAVPWKKAADAVDARYPLRLTTGRLRDQWHGLSRTGRVPQLFGAAPEPALSMNGGDLARRGLREGDLVRVESRRGAIHVRVAIDEDVRSGQAYLPMHWGRRFLGGRGSAGVNTLLPSAHDPVSKQPELKHAAVKVSPAGLAWRFLGFARLPAADVAEAMARVAALQDGLAFASVVPLAGEVPGVLVRAAHAGAPEASIVAALEALLGTDRPEAMRYEDARRGASRRIVLAGDALAAVRLCGDEDALAAGAWLLEWLAAGRPVGAIRRALLLPLASPPVDFKPAGRIVCQCHGVGEARIREALQACAPGMDAMDQVERTLGCGTRCGSCRPELRALAAQAGVASRQVA